MSTAQVNGKATRKSALPLALIADDLQRVELVLAEALAAYRPRFGPLLDHLHHYRGKRLRPALLLLAAHACGKVTAAHHTLAAVVEMIHTATLVHDDVLDDADLRRHVPTVNARWGNKGSILLGDLLFTNAFHLASTLGDARACAWIGAATNRVCAGELHQLSEAGNLSLSLADYLAIIEGKTAALTECACRLGAAYAGAAPERVEKFARYGRDLGMAFQVADDVMDLTGDEHKAGKTLGTDLRQRKLTLPLIYLFEQIPEAECIRLQRLLRDGTEGAAEEVASALARHGAAERSRGFADRLAAQAREALAGLEPSPHGEALTLLTHWAVRREC